MVELALVTPILLLILAAAADFGRAFYAYVAIENAAKEGAMFGSRNPICDNSAGGACGDPNNVTWHVRQELKNQGVRNPDGTELTPAIRCIAPNGTAHANLDDCAQGDTYEVVVVYPFLPLTPMLGSVVGDLQLTSTSRSVVLNLAFDPTPGASVQKLVSPTGATNAADVVSRCLEPDDSDSAGFYRNPCLDSSTTDPSDKIQLRFESGALIQYKLTVGNSGGQALTSVAVADSKGSTGCAFPTTLAVGATATPCLYQRTAPVVPGAGVTMPYANTATIDSAQTLPATDTVTVAIDKPPPELSMDVWVSSFHLGSDGDGQEDGDTGIEFGTLDTIDIGLNSLVPNEAVTYQVIVRNTGGQSATGMAVTVTDGSLPVNADCPAVPSTLAANSMWICRYRVPQASPGPIVNVASVTSTNVTPDAGDTDSATVTVSNCTGASRVIPNLIGLGSSAAAQADWTAKGFTGVLTDDDGHNNQAVEHQSRQAYQCMSPTTTMSFGNDQTP